MWNGNHFGSSMISIGMTGTLRQEIIPKSDSSTRVNTLQFTPPPRARMASRARRIWSAWGFSPIIFSAKYAFTLALISKAPSWNKGQPPCAP